MGKLFVIDGTDASGKQTQYDLLYKRLKKENIEILKLSFPRYDNPSSALVKMYLSGEFGENAKDIDPYIASTFYAADRYASYIQDMLPFYEKHPNGVILADRYTTANMVHQAGKISNKLERQRFLDWLFDYEFNIYKIPKPDKVIFLNMPPEYAIKLMENRNNKFTGQVAKDIHEKDKNHLIDAYNAACDVSKEYNWEEIKCIKDSKIRTKEDIHNEIYNIILEEIQK